MRSVVSMREESGQTLSARLRSVWYVDADGSYRRICAKPIDDTEYIAVRTLTGRGRIGLYDGTVLMVGPGSLCLLRSKQIARYETDGEAWEFYWFQFDLHAGKISGTGECREIRLSAQEQAELERCFMGLSSGAQAEVIRAEALFNYLLADWQVRRAETNTGGVATEEIITLMEKGRLGQMSIVEMAREAGMCERSFRDAVRRATGLSPKAYLIRGEMTAAMELLRTSDMSVTDIAACFNYSSPLYFSRAFKKHYGISPQRVRDGIKL